MKVHAAHRDSSRKDRVAPLVRDRKPWYSLPREFYKDHRVYEAEIERIWKRGWLFVGHSCELKEPGQYVTFRVDNDSLIVLRGDDGQVKAFWNLCRHRGTELCTQDAGKVGRFVCPYHQWTYTRDGQLASCRGMQEDLDKSQLNLFPAHAREMSGMVFASFSDDPPDFAEAARTMEPLIQPQGLAKAKVAKTVDYEVPANWKIVWENNRECYHCNVNHPQYIKANFDHYNADDTTERIQCRIDEVVAKSQEQWGESNLALSHRSSGMATFPDAERNLWYSANRTPLVKGYVSETMDGKQKAPLMGDYTDSNVGTLRVRTVPNMWFHASCDHAMSTRLLPAGMDKTLVRVNWLVHEDAVEGTDYKLEEIMPFWQLTSEQDWDLCEKAQKGISSSRYTPGPLSTYKEYNVEAFLAWCVKQLGED